MPESQKRFDSSTHHVIMSSCSLWHEHYHKQSYCTHQCKQ